MASKKKSTPEVAIEETPAVESTVEETPTPTVEEALAEVPEEKKFVKRIDFKQIDNWGFSTWSQYVYYVHWFNTGILIKSDSSNPLTPVFLKRKDCEEVNFMNMENAAKTLANRAKNQSLVFLNSIAKAVETIPAELRSKETVKAIVDTFFKAKEVIAETAESIREPQEEYMI